MSPERWRQVDAIFQTAAELAPGERLAYLSAACGPDQDLRREVESMLEHDVADTCLDRAIREESAAMLADHSPPERAGPYRLTGLIGRGGMGVVYHGVRDDDVYGKQVAVKLVKRGMDTDFVLDRFRSERQILAHLEHPNIARLLDGGSTRDGRPYFVMEYVEGEPITGYCESRKLPVVTRLRLFLSVCAAVQHAHQKLVVHRDLKPTNILVTADGTVKLLDFGIARLLATGEEGAPEHTVAAMRMLTPAYASPEHTQGGPVSTASDVYSLGVVLNELLTGHPGASSRHERGRALTGDLENILHMALRKEPERRYATVDQFADDIQRHLSHRPVLARPDTVRYRAHKFLRRNRLPVAAAVLIAVSLIAGILVAAWQWRRAERRFDQLHNLANALIYDVHDEIHELSGSTRARQKIVTTALQYLNGLEREGGANGRLQRDMAAAYSRIGDVQGGAMLSNLGDRKAALESYDKARALLEPMAMDAETIRKLADLEVRIASLASYTAGSAAAAEILRRAQARLEPIASAAGASPEVRSELANVCWQLAGILGDARDHAGAEESARKALALYEALVQEQPRNRNNHLSVAETALSRALSRRGKTGEALPHARRGVEFAEALVAADPGNIASRRVLMLSYSHLADVLGSPTSPSMGDTAGAVAVYRKMQVQAEHMTAADPSDRRAAFDRAMTLQRLGSALLETAATAEGVACLRASVDGLRAIAAAEPGNSRARVFLSTSLKRVGDGLLAQRAARDALDSYEEAIRQGEAAIASEPIVTGMMAAAHSGAGLALSTIRRHDEALGEGRRGVELCETARSKQPSNVRAAMECAAARAALGRIQLAAGQRASGCADLETSLAEYESVRKGSGLSPRHRTDLERVQAEAAGCATKPARR